MASSMEEEMDEELQASTSEDDSSFPLLKAVHQLGNCIKTFEEVVGCLVSRRTDNTESLLLFREQHEFVVDLTKQICAHVLSESSTDDNGKALGERIFVAFSKVVDLELRTI